MPKWNIVPSALDEPKILKRTLPDWTKQDHEEAALAFEDAADDLERDHWAAVEAAEHKYGSQGSLVAGGLREHWPKAVKDKIRKFVRVSYLKDAARAHRAAMNFRPYVARPGTGFARRR